MAQLEPSLVHYLFEHDSFMTEWTRFCVNKTLKPLLDSSIGKDL